MPQEQENRFICTNCGVPSRRFQHRCPYCRTDGVLMRDRMRSETVHRRIARFDQLACQHFERIDTGIPSLNEALGGGLVPGSVVVVYGQPGAGKSTMLLQAACSPAMRRTVYASGEEASAQVTIALQRLGLTGVQTASFMHTNSTGDLIAAISSFEPVVAFCDSVQSFTSDKIRGSMGSASQVKKLVEDLVKLAKATQTVIVLVGQVNASGKLAGPKKMPFWVDAVIEVKEVTIGGEDYVQLLTTKNRFGATGRSNRNFLKKMGGGLFSVPKDGVLKPRIVPAPESAPEPPRPLPKLMTGLELAASLEAQKKSQGRVSVPENVALGETLQENTVVPGRVTPSGLVVIEGGRNERGPDLLDTIMPNMFPAADAESENDMDDPDDDGDDDAG